MVFSRVDVLDSRNQAEAAALVAASDVILLAGGHVPTQNAFFRALGLRSLLAAYPGVIVGVSAGSMNAADTVYAQAELAGEAVDPAYRKFLTGLGLTDINICPHYQMLKDSILDGMRLFDDITYADSRGRRFLALPDGSYVLIRDGKAEVWGEAWQIADGKLTAFCGRDESRSVPSSIY
jgi:dipeptidase E